MTGANPARRRPPSQPNYRVSVRPPSLFPFSLSGIKVSAIGALRVEPSTKTFYRA